MAACNPFARRCSAAGLTLVAGFALAIVPARAQDTPSEPPAPPRTAFDATSTLQRSQLREAAISTLVEASESADPLLRANAIEALQKTPNRAVDAVRRGLRDENMGVRYVAAMTASELRLRTVVRDLEPLLEDPEPVVRAAAICALRNCGQEVDPTLLARMLASKKLRLRAQAAFTLGEMGDPSAIPMLRDMTSEDTDDATPSQQRLFRLQVAEALIKLGWKDGMHAVRAALYPSSPEEVEGAILAAQIIGEVRDQTSVPELVNRVEDRVSGSSAYLMPPEMRLAAATSLARLGYTDGRYVAMEYIGAQADVLRQQAVIALGYTGTLDDLQILDAMMRDDPAPIVRLGAASAILTLAQRYGGGSQ